VFSCVDELYDVKFESRDSDWLRAGRPRGLCSCPSRGNNFLPSTPSRPALGRTKPFVQGVPGAVSPGVKPPRREADNLELVPWIYTFIPPYVFTT
jgi:hypothetical protein